jgi:hypothetical protein
MLPPRPAPILAASCPSGGIGRRSGLRPPQLSPRREIPGVKPVKVGEGPEAARFELMPSQAPETPGEGVESRRRAPKAPGYGEGVLQPTNPRAPARGAAKAAAGRKSAALKSVSVRLRPRADPPPCADVRWPSPASSQCASRRSDRARLTGRYRPSAEIGYVRYRAAKRGC